MNTQKQRIPFDEFITQYDPSSLPPDKREAVEALQRWHLHNPCGFDPKSLKDCDDGWWKPGKPCVWPYPPEDGKKIGEPPAGIINRCSYNPHRGMEWDLLIGWGIRLAFTFWSGKNAHLSSRRVGRPTKIEAAAKEAEEAELTREWYKYGQPQHFALSEWRATPVSVRKLLIRLLSMPVR
jgi:hypothetical protein